MQELDGHHYFALTLSSGLFPFPFQYVILIPLSKRLDRIISHASGFVLRAHMMG